MTVRKTKAANPDLARIRECERQIDEAQNKINSLSAERVSVTDLRAKWTQALDFLERQMKDAGVELRRSDDAIRNRIDVLELWQKDLSAREVGIEEFEGRMKAAENLVHSLSVSVETLRTQKQKAVRGEINALIDRVEKFEVRFSQSHDSLAFHCNQLSAQVVALQEDVLALERPWWQRIFRRNK